MKVLAAVLGRVIMQFDLTRRCFVISMPALLAACSREPRQTALSSGFTATSEFEAQEFIWMTWSENGFLGGPPMSDAIVPALRALTPHVRVRLLYSQWTSWLDQYANKAPPRTLKDAKARIETHLSAEGVDISRIEFIRSSFLPGALQDPGPYFLRNSENQLAIADFASAHPIAAVGAVDQEMARHLGLPMVATHVASDGGNRQNNGKGVLMLGEAFARSINPDLSLDEIEAEHSRVHGAQKMIWLKQGARDEDAGLLEDGRWGIGTAGHVDEFARFADARTILLAEVLPEDRDLNAITRETHRRMEENFDILSRATDQDGQPFRILRVPFPDLMTAQMKVDEMSEMERYFFEDASPGETVTFYLPGSYLNFIIANGAVITSKFWRDGMADSMRRKDELGRAALEDAFPGREIIQIDTHPLLYDASGLHCYSRNQPFAKKREIWN
ncbi:MAG TPA: agmatine deiminase family protein [Parvularculaceae bacterium]|nr:agmatine deiminase family protein [Parvularculaceae bacterium]